MKKLNKFLIMSAFAMVVLQGANAGLPEDAILLSCDGKNTPVYLGLGLISSVAYSDPDFVDTAEVYFAPESADLIEKLLRRGDDDKDKLVAMDRIRQNVAGYLFGEKLLGRNVVTKLNLYIDKQLLTPIGNESLKPLLSLVKALGIKTVELHALVMSRDPIASIESHE